MEADVSHPSSSRIAEPEGSSNALLNSIVSLLHANPTEFLTADEVASTLGRPNETETIFMMLLGLDTAGEHGIWGLRAPAIPRRRTRFSAGRIGMKPEEIHSAPNAGPLPPTTENLRAFVERLREEEIYDDEEGIWNFLRGGRVFIPAHSARRIVQLFGGRVAGYSCQSNPTALIGTEYADDGHDFALIDEHIVVDYYSFVIKEAIERPYFSLRCKADMEQIRTFYGDPEKWVTLGANS